jgi:hypothetical protein
MKLWFRLTLVVVVLLIGVVVIVAVTSGGDDKTVTASNASSAGPVPALTGPQIRIGDLIYNITGVHVFDYKSPESRPYLTNIPAPTPGTQLMGVFMRAYNVGTKPQPLAAAFLLEPQKNPNLVEMVIDVQTPLAMDVTSSVPAAGVYPAAGTSAAKSKWKGAMLLYAISGPSTRAQPFDLVIHDAAGGIAKLEVPRIKVLPGNVEG